MHEYLINNPLWSPNVHKNNNNQYQEKDIDFPFFLKKLYNRPTAHVEEVLTETICTSRDFILRLKSEKKTTPQLILEEKGQWAGSK